MCAYHVLSTNDCLTSSFYVLIPLAATELPTITPTELPTATPSNPPVRGGTPPPTPPSTDYP